MGLRCLMGHDFGEVQTDRDRRERGDEVIVTIREYRECVRCGEDRVISENKEVRHARTASEAPDTDARSEAAVSDGAADQGTEPTDDVAADDDDGVILEDEPEERDPGAWPNDPTEEADAEEDDTDDPAPWPEVEGEDEGFAAEPAEGGSAEGVEFNSGLTPEASASDADAGTEDSGEVVESVGGAGSGFRRASPSPTPTGRQRARSADAEFYCPECEHTIPAQDSSNRPGDICPNCRMGYLTEREP